MEEQILNCLQLIISKYGNDLAIQVEQVFRNETKHFKSGGFIETLSPGMEAFKEFQPYGWFVVDKFWKENPNYAPAGIIIKKENSSGMMESRGDRRFLKFPNLEASFMTVAYILNSRGGDGGSWFSVTDATQRKKYNDFLKQIKPRFVNQLINNK